MPSSLREFRLCRRGPAFPLVLAGAVVGLVAGGCRGREGDAATRPDADRSATPAAVAAETPAAAVTAPAPDGPPRMDNPDPPFRYPSALYARKVQGNVTLRLWIDSTGAVRAESTRVAEPSDFPALDSSAVAGSQKLRFTPGRREGRSVGAAILFPVYFRHPEAPPFPGDSVLPARP
jgi:protein TonB